MAEQLKEQINAVVEARKLLGIVVDTKKLLHDEWENQNMELLHDVASKITIVGEAEDKLRELTLEAYTETGNKAPEIGVGIREITQLIYDNKVAFDWAKAHKMALKLDKSTFEKIAKVDPPEFVKLTTEPQATIATELAKVE